ncbi:unnamed protein product, partial [Symbiodinium microadriaticum]
MFGNGLRTSLAIVALIQQGYPETGMEGVITAAFDPLAGESRFFTAPDLLFNAMLNADEQMSRHIVPLFVMACANEQPEHSERSPAGIHDNGIFRFCPVAAGSPLEGSTNLRVAQCRILAEAPAMLSKTVFSIEDCESGKQILSASRAAVLQHPAIPKAGSPGMERILFFRTLRYQGVQRANQPFLIIARLDLSDLAIPGAGVQVEHGLKPQQEMVSVLSAEGCHSCSTVGASLLTAGHWCEWRMNASLSFTPADHRRHRACPDVVFASVDLCSLFQRVPSRFCASVAGAAGHPKVFICMNFGKTLLKADYARLHLVQAWLMSLNASFRLFARYVVDAAKWMLYMMDDMGFLFVTWWRKSVVSAKTLLEMAECKKQLAVRCKQTGKEVLEACLFSGDAVCSTRSLGSTAYPTATIGAFKELREPVAIEVVNRVSEHEAYLGVRKKQASVVVVRIVSSASQSAACLAKLPAYGTHVVLRAAGCLAVQIPAAMHAASGTVPGGTFPAVKLACVLSADPWPIVLIRRLGGGASEPPDLMSRHEVEKFQDGFAPLAVDWGAFLLAAWLKALLAAKDSASSRVVLT